MLGSVLIVAGVVLAIGSMLAGFYLVNLGCSMGGASGCKESGLKLIVDLMTSPEGVIFWAAVAIGFVMIAVGYKLKAYSERDL